MTDTMPIPCRAQCKVPCRHNAKYHVLYNAKYHVQYNAKYHIQYNVRYHIGHNARSMSGTMQGTMTKISTRGIPLSVKQIRRRSVILHPPLAGLAKAKEGCIMP